MICPSCNSELRISKKEGVEIDVCPSCRGVWLDRGELEKILERSQRQYNNDFDDDDRNERRRYDDDDHYDKHREGNYKRRKKSFFEDLFD